jgi:hypothetical protein
MAKKAVVKNWLTIGAALLVCAALNVLGLLTVQAGSSAGERRNLVVVASVCLVLGSALTFMAAAALRSVRWAELVLECTLWALAVIVVGAWLWVFAFDRLSRFPFFIKAAMAALALAYTAGNALVLHLGRAAPAERAGFPVITSARR